MKNMCAHCELCEFATTRFRVHLRSFRRNRKHSNTRKRTEKFYIKNIGARQWVKPEQYAIYSVTTR